MGTERNPLELAARALRHRDRSAADVDARLERAGVDEERRAETLETLERVGYVDDARFAATRAAALAARGWGDAGIRAALEAESVAIEVIEAALAQLDPEPERARAIATRDGRTLRTARRLAARGFSDDAIEGAVGTDVAEEGAEPV